MQDFFVVNDQHEKIPYRYYPNTSTTPTKGTVVVIHGGAFVAGNLESLAHVCVALNSVGYDAVAVTYTLSSVDVNIIRGSILGLIGTACVFGIMAPALISAVFLAFCMFTVIVLTIVTCMLEGNAKTKHPRHVRDVSAAIADIVKNPHINTEKLHVLGHSAGGHIAGLIATDERFLCEVGLNKTSISSYVLLSALLAKEEMPFGDLVARSVFDMTGPFKWVWPLENVCPGLQPVLVVTCDGDTFLNSQALRFNERMQAANNKMKLVYASGRHHCNIHRDWDGDNANVLKAITNFLQ